MAKERLKKEEIDRLLGDLFGERRLLMYKLTRVRDAIAELKKVRSTKEDDANAKPAAPKRGPGRPPGTGGKRAVRRKRGRPRKRKVVGGYRLNEWDKMVAGAVKGADRLLTKQDLMAISTAWAKREFPKMKGAEVELRLTRTLQKLSGKRGVLGYHRTGKMRGVHYGLSDWFFNGKLRQEHKDKVVLED